MIRLDSSETSPPLPPYDNLYKGSGQSLTPFRLHHGKPLLPNSRQDLTPPQNGIQLRKIAPLGRPVELLPTRPPGTIPVRPRPLLGAPFLPLDLGRPSVRGRVVGGPPTLRTQFLFSPTFSIPLPNIFGGTRSERTPFDLFRFTRGPQ